MPDQRDLACPPLIAIEVDDLFLVGGEFHRKQLEKLKEKFAFGKWVTLKERPGGAMFNGRRIRQKADGEFQIDMQKFVEERLSEIKLDKGRGTEKKDDASEKAQMRAACGSLNWLSISFPLYNL